MSIIHLMSNPYLAYQYIITRLSGVNIFSVYTLQNKNKESSRILLKKKNRGFSKFNENRKFQATLEGHQRAIMGNMSVEEI